MKRVKQLALNYCPVMVLFGIASVLFVQNYVPETFLTGWDNLHPEYDFPTNIQRSLFAVWQEYQSLGLLGGMGHASDLVHQLILLFLSFFLPLHLLRYIWVFLMLFLGSLGAFFLLKFILSYKRLNTKAKIQNTVPFFGALYYLLNLSTVQTFYAPFEAFIAHFAFLPWMLFASLLFFLKGNKKSLIFLALVLFLSTPASYIPTLFVVYLLALLVVLTSFSLLNLKDNRLRYFLKKFFKLFLVIFLVNAFWLLPFLYFTLTQASVNLNSKINQMATETIFYRNKAFGDLFNVALLKGFWFDNVDPNLKGNFGYMLKPWRSYFSNPLISLIGISFFGLITLGFLKTLKDKRRLELAFAVLFLFSLTMLATNTPPFSYATDFLRKVPLFNQSFRFPFTKFSVLASLAYALFFALGTQTLFGIIQARFEKRISPRSLLIAGYLLLVALLVVFVWPAFKGDLFYEKERLTVPKEYFQVFDYFKKQDPNTRIANFPQNSFWGWTFYKWPQSKDLGGPAFLSGGQGGSYGGSGFLWYGIKQPIIDRAFDVWSQTSENYYYEIANALYTKDPASFENTVNKYQINYLLVDKSVFDPVSSMATFIPQLEEIIRKTPSIEKAAVFGNIDIYKVQLRDNPENYLYAKGPLPSFNAYSWGDNDIAYRDFGNYLSYEPLLAPDYLLPFRSLFSEKTEKEKEFILTEDPDYLVLTSLLKPNPKTKYLHLPSSTENESIVIADVVAKKEKDRLLINFVVKSPQVFLGDKLLWKEEVEMPVFETSANAETPLKININGVVSFNYEGLSEKIGTTFLTLNQDNILVVTDRNRRLLQSQVIQPTLLQTLPMMAKQTVLLPENNREPLMVKIPKIKDGYLNFEAIPQQEEIVKNCDRFEDPAKTGRIESRIIYQNDKRLVSFETTNTTACLSLFSGNLPHWQSYAIFIDQKNVKGRSFHFWILNEDENYSPLDIYLPSDKKEGVASLILSPQENFGKAYSFHFENISIGQEETINQLGGIKIFPLPYRFLTQIALSENGTYLPQKGNQSFNVKSLHPNESLYLIDEPETLPGDGFLILSQSYDPGWKAYRIPNARYQILNTFLPFVFGEELRGHTKVNNWENGWLIDNHNLPPAPYNLIVVYLPQYLEYLGFLMLLPLIVWLIKPIKPFKT